MPINIECPQCYSTYRVSRQYAGKKTRCKACGASIRVASSDEPQQEVFDFAADVSPPRTAALPPRRESRPRKSRSSRTKASPSGLPVGPILLVIGGVFLVLFVATLFKPKLAPIFIAPAVWIGFALYLWGMISLIVGAFKESVLKGVACFFFTGIYAIYVGLNDWQKVARPVKLILFSYGLYFAALVVTFTSDKVGGEPDQRAAAQQTRNDHVAQINGQPARLAPQQTKRRAEPVVDSSAPYSLNVAKSKVPRFNERTFPKMTFGGVEVYDCVFQFDNTSAFEPGARMQFRVYLPPGTDQNHSLPCVLVPPAGTPLFTGSPIDDDKQNLEHLPYVRAGYAVVTFSLDGFLRDLSNATDGQLSVAYRQFRDAAAGMINARIAFLFAQQLPVVDSNRIYIAGHSSAATLALLYAAHEPELAGCLAYAPATDVEGHLAPVAKQTSSDLFPGFKEFTRRSSPKTHAARIQCPVFVYHARGDTVASFSKTKSYCDQLRATGKDVTFIEGTGDDHYGTMISDGIPAGLAWLAERMGTSTSPNQPAMAANSRGGADTSTSSRGLGDQIATRRSPPLSDPSEEAQPPFPGAGDDVQPAFPSQKADGPAGTKPVTDETELAIGTRVIAKGGVFWEGAEILELHPNAQAKVHFFRLPEAFDEVLPYSRIRLPLPAEELDDALQLTIHFEVHKYFGDAPPDEEAIENDYLELEGYFPGSLSLDRKAMRISVQVVRGSRADDQAIFPLLRGKFSTHRLDEHPNRRRAR